jgi:hypothetical protein
LGAGYLQVALYAPLNKIIVKDIKVHITKTAARTPKMILPTPTTPIREAEA